MIPAANAAFQYDAFNRLTKATYPEKIYDYAYDPFGNMLAAKENGLTVFNKSYSPANRISDFSYDSRGNQMGGNGFTQVWDKRNRLVESRTSANVLLGNYVYNERGLRIKAERISQPMVQVVEPNGGESLYLGAMNTVSWSGLGLAGGTVKLELLVDGAVDGTIAEGIPGELTSYQWQAGKMLGGWANAGTNYKVRVTAVAPPVASGTTYYFYDSVGRLLAEYDGTGVCVKDYLYLGGKMIGEFVPSTGSYYYYAADQINSTRLVTDSTGVIVHSAQYDPYGGLYKTWVDAYHPKPGFSGKEREFGSEMDYFGGRYYSHLQFRFLSTDPIINKEEAIEYPQLLNLYYYCRNNPLTFYDPDGRRDELILRMENQIRRAERMFNQYHDNIENEYRVNNINYTKINKRLNTLLINGIAAITSLIGFKKQDVIGDIAADISTVADLTNTLRTEDIDSISPEIAERGAVKMTKGINAVRKYAGELRMFNSKKAGRGTGAIASMFAVFSESWNICTK